MHDHLEVAEDQGQSYLTSGQQLTFADAVINQTLKDVRGFHYDKYAEEFLQERSPHISAREHAKSRELDRVRRLQFQIHPTQLIRRTNHERGQKVGVLICGCARRQSLRFVSAALWNSTNLSQDVEISKVNMRCVLQSLCTTKTTTLMAWFHNNHNCQSIGGPKLSARKEQQDYLSLDDSAILQYIRLVHNISYMRPFTPPLAMGSFPEVTRHLHTKSECRVVCSRHRPQTSF